MQAGHQIKNHLQKTGGVMTGALDMNGQMLKWGNGDVALKVSNGGFTLEVRNLADTAYKSLQGDALTVFADINMQPTKLVDGRDISAMVRAKIKVGTYTGNGADNRNIDIGVNPETKTNVFLIINVVAPGVGRSGMMRDEHGQGDMSFPFDATPNVANRIQSFYDSGFQVGDDPNVNTNGDLYLYTIMWEEP